MIPLIIGRLTFLLGLLDILGSTLKSLAWNTIRSTAVTSVGISSATAAVSIFVGVVLLLLGRSLVRRKRRAHHLAVGILIFSIVTELLRTRIHIVQTLLAFTVLIALIIWAREFYAISDPSTRFSPILGFGIAVITAVILGYFTVEFRHGNQIKTGDSFIDVVKTVIEGLAWVNGPTVFRNPRTDSTVGLTLGYLGIATILVPLWLYLRKVKPLISNTSEDIAIINDLIKLDDNQDSLGYFATRQDKSVIWSDNKKAGIAYRVQNGVMLASGDPFGEYSLWPETIEKFFEEARLHAWTPAVMGASDLGGEVWVEHGGMLAVDIGDEAIINVKDFTLEGRPMANVRQMVNRIKRKGYTTKTMRWGEVDSIQQAKLRELSKTWRYGVAERGFSMSMDRFGESIDSDCLITITELEGDIKGFLYFVPWGENRVSLDRMMREKGTDPGVTELMIAETVVYAQENNITHISLNFAAFRNLFERADKISAGPIVRTTRNIIRFFSNWFQIESLFRFNAKFQPEWRTRYVIYPKSTDLIRVAIATLRAEKFIGGFGRPDKKLVS